MTTYSDFQSIFQLAAGLTLGVSGLVALFEDPVDKEERRVSALSKRIALLKKRHLNVPDDLSGKMENLTLSADDLQEKISIEADRDGRFWLTKLLSFVASAIGLGFLLVSSEYAESPLPDWIRIISYVLLAYAPVAILLLWHQFSRVAVEFKGGREKIDTDYIKLVNEIRGWKRGQAGQ